VLPYDSLKPAKSIAPEAEFRSRLSWFLGVSDPVAIDPDAFTYEPFFGLREKPFSLAADPRFFFTESGHGTAFNTLAAGIKRREGILVLTGEVGTGKTTLCRAVLESLDRKTFAAFVTDPFLTREDLLKTLLVDFGVVSPAEIRHGALRGASRADLSFPLQEFLTSLVPLKAFAVAIIDEAQCLSPDVLDEIRVLSDLESGPKLLQIFLVGQPELDARLSEPALRQLAQRVAIRSELPPLSVPEVGAYIAHRLAVAGSQDHVRFTEAAVEAVHDASGGIPRVINLLCDRALTRAAILQTFVVDAESVAWGRNDLKLPGLPPPALALVHSQSTRPSWRDIQADDHPQEVTLSVPPESLVTMVSGAMGEPDSAHQPSAPPVPEISRIHAHLEPNDATGQHVDGPKPVVRFTFLALGLALALAAAVVAYRARSATPATSTTPAQPRAEQLTTPPPDPVPARSEPVKPPEATAAAPAVAAPTAASAAPQSRVAILMATFVSDDRTEKSLQEIRDAGFLAYRLDVSLRDGGSAIAVYAGPYDDRVTAERDLSRARELPGYEGARIVSIKSTIRP